MADKNVKKLAPLFDDKSKFVHMSGTWKKDEELDIIKTGRIWYKNTKVHDTAVEIFGKTAIIWSRITLEAIVRGNEAVTEFTVTEIYQKQGNYQQALVASQQYYQLRAQKDADARVLMLSSFQNRLEQAQEDNKAA